MDIYPNILIEFYVRGYELSIHTYSHSQLTKLDPLTLDAEISRTQEACFKASGTEPTLIRPPYGAKNDNVKNAFHS